MIHSKPIIDNIENVDNNKDNNKNNIIIISIFIFIILDEKKSMIE